MSAKDLKIDETSKNQSICEVWLKIDRDMMLKQEKNDSDG